MSWTYQSWGTEYPRIAVDLTGNHAADILGFGYDGVWVSLNDGNGNFSRPNIGIHDFCIATGWSTEKHARFLADVTGNGRPDIIGFGDDGVYVAENNGDGTFQPVKSVLQDLVYNSGWSVHEHPRFVIDLNDDGKADIIGFGDGGVWTAMNNGDGSFRPANLVIEDFGFNQAWSTEKHLRFVTDLNGNGKPDIIGFGETGIHIALGNGDGTFQPVQFVPSNLCYNQGWRVGKHIRLIGDVMGDGKPAIVAAKDNGEILLALGNGDGTFQPPQPAGVSLGYLYDNFRESDFTIDFTSYLIFFGRHYRQWK